MACSTPWPSTHPNAILELGSTIDLLRVSVHLSTEQELSSF